MKEECTKHPGDIFTKLLLLIFKLLILLLKFGIILYSTIIKVLSELETNKCDAILCSCTLRPKYFSVCSNLLFFSLCCFDHGLERAPVPVFM